MQGKSDFSIAGEVLPRTEQPISPCSGEPVLPLERRDQFGHHLAAALDVLSPSEQHRLMTALNQPSTGACVEAMWNLCMGSAPDGSDVEHTGHYSQPLDPQYYIDEGCWDSSPQCRQAGVSPVEYVQPYPVDTPADRTFCVGAKSMASWTQAGFRAQPPVAESQHPLRNAENDPVASQKRERVPTRKLLGSELGCEFESIESEQTIAKKKKKKPARSSPKPTVAVVTSVKVPKDGAGHAHKIRKPQSCKSSLRDRIWDLLHDSEKNKLLTEEMSAAEGAILYYSRCPVWCCHCFAAQGSAPSLHSSLRASACFHCRTCLLVQRSCCVAAEHHATFNALSYAIATKNTARRS